MGCSIRVDLSCYFTTIKIFSSIERDSDELEI